VPKTAHRLSSSVRREGAIDVEDPSVARDLLQELAGFVVKVRVTERRDAG
jgi:hypothetical protein